MNDIQQKFVLGLVGKPSATVYKAKWTFSSLAVSTVTLSIKISVYKAKTLLICSDGFYVLLIVFD